MLHLRTASPRYKELAGLVSARTRGLAIPPKVWQFCAIAVVASFGERPGRLGGQRSGPYRDTLLHSLMMRTRGQLGGDSSEASRKALRTWNDVLYERNEVNRHLKHKRYTLLKSTCTCTRQCRAEYHEQKKRYVGHRGS